MTIIIFMTHLVTYIPYQSSLNTAVVSDHQVTLYVERLFGSQGSIQIRYHTTGDVAVAGIDFEHIENGAVTLDSRQTTSSIFVRVSRGRSESSRLLLFIYIYLLSIFYLFISIFYISVSLVFNYHI